MHSESLFQFQNYFSTVFHKLAHNSPWSEKIIKLIVRFSSYSRNGEIIQFQSASDNV